MRTSRQINARRSEARTSILPEGGYFGHFSRFRWDGTFPFSQCFNASQRLMSSVSQCLNETTGTETQKDQNGLQFFRIPTTDRDCLFLNKRSLLGKFAVTSQWFLVSPCFLGSKPLGRYKTVDFLESTSQRSNRSVGLDGIDLDRWVVPYFLFVSSQ